MFNFFRREPDPFIKISFEKGMLRLQSNMTDAEMLDTIERSHLNIAEKCLTHDCGGERCQVARSAIKHVAKLRELDDELDSMQVILDR